ncbi:MAG: hypothetical protein AB1806_05765 [Acidobacteriota bacterium]
MMVRRNVVLGMLSAAVACAILSSPAGLGSAAPAEPAYVDPPELVLLLAGSARDPFSDLSGYGHVVRQAPGSNGPVETVWDSDLGRHVFSFTGQNWLEVLDTFGLLTLTSADELTIEVSLKLLDDGMVYHCGTPPLPITQPVPDQAVFSKGPLSGYPRNYALVFTWGRDDMRRRHEQLQAESVLRQDRLHPGLQGTSSRRGTEQQPA